MASLLCRTTSFVARTARRSLSLTAIRASTANPSTTTHDGKSVTEKKKMPDTMGHSVGLERDELLALKAGLEDPFQQDAIMRTGGTADDPTLVPSTSAVRLVGCVCEEDATSINWMYLNRGEARRCYCGYWFQMVDIRDEETVAQDAAGHH